MRILLTNGRAPACLDLARKLSFAGHSVFISDSFKFHLCINSNAVEKCFRTPSPRYNLDAYEKRINQIINENNIEMIIPCFEEAFYISILKDKLHCKKIFIEDIDLLYKLHDKELFAKIVSSIGLTSPKSKRITSLDDIDQSTFSSKDSVLKPCFSRYGEEVIISPENYDLDLNISNKRPWVIQEKILGREYCAYGVCIEGDINQLGVYPVKITYGKVCISFESISNNDSNEISKWLQTFIKKINFTGQIGFDFIVNAHGVFALECNPRMTSGIHLFNDDKNFSKSFFERAKNTSFPETNIIKNMTLLFFIDLKNIKYKIKNILRGSDIVFRLKDPFPFINQFILFLYIVYLSLGSRKSISGISSDDIEWNGEFI